MDFAAAAVVNTAPPPARPDATAPDDGPSFRDHMDAERAVEARRTPQAERPDTAATRTEDEEQNNDQAMAAPIVLVAPLVVQIAVAAPAETPAPPLSDIEPAPTAPAASAAPPQMPAPAPAQQPVQQSRQANVAPKDQAKFESPPNVESADGAPLPQASPQTGAADAPAATASQPASAPPSTQALQPSADALAALQVNAQPATKSELDKASREVTPKIEGAVEAKRDTPTSQNVEPTKKQGKPANSQNSVQAKSVEAPFQPAQEVPAPTQAPAQLQAPSSYASSQALQSGADQGAPRAAPAAAQVGREIIRRFNGHNTQFELRLDPPELGRVDVRLEVSRDHRVTATISADTPQALAEMARHARELEQSLQSAGLELADNGLSFDLRQGSGDEREAADESGGAQTAALRFEEEVQTIAPRARPVGFERWRGVRVDVMA
ncbi:MAG: flagellar hook-length control protein FliK [Terricaulis sp.]